MKNNYQLVKEVIDQWDPIGLLELGCPDDEYDPEIRDIVKLLINAQSIDQLALGIQDVFMRWFSQEIEIEACYQVAIKIWIKLYKSI